MNTKFEKQQFCEENVTKEEYVQMFAELGFTADKVRICLTNGCSAYVSLNIRVLNENKLSNEVFVYDDMARIIVRVSDHKSNLERICGGVSGNNVSFAYFSELVENNVIENLN
jgi:hypothetical protein